MNAADAATLASIVAKISTVGIARAMIGQATNVLSSGYAQLSNIPTTAVGGFLFGIKTDSPTETRDAAKGLLDTVNAYAGRVFARLSADPGRQQDPLTLKDHAATGTILVQAFDALHFIEKQITDLSFDFLDGLKTTLATVGGAVGAGVQGITNAAAAGGWAFVRGAWPTLLFLLGVVALFYWAKKRQWKAVLPW